MKYQESQYPKRNSIIAILLFLAMIISCNHTQDKEMNRYNALQKKDGFWIEGRNTFEQSGYYKDGIRVGVWRTKFEGELVNETLYKKAVLSEKDTLYIEEITRFKKGKITYKSTSNFSIEQKIEVYDTLRFLEGIDRRLVGEKGNNKRGGMVFYESCYESCHDDRDLLLSNLIRSSYLNDNVSFKRYLHNNKTCSQKIANISKAKFDSLFVFLKNTEIDKVVN